MPISSIARSLNSISFPFCIASFMSLTLVGQYIAHQLNVKSCLVNIKQAGSDLE